MSAVRSDHERICNEIQLKYKEKMKDLRAQMEKRRKREIQKIEVRKNAKIKECTVKHEQKYQEIKDYYGDITSTNLDIIKFLKDDLTTATQEAQTSQKEYRRNYNANKNVTEPLHRAKQEKLELRNKQLDHTKIKEDLEVCTEEIRTIESTYKEGEWEYEVKLQQFTYLEEEKKSLFDEFHRLVYEMHQKTGLRNLIMEKKLETIQESLDAKEASINQILTAANIDPDRLGMVRSTLDEVENIKNEAIKSIQVELKKIREAHSNMVKTYEGKLSEFGIPVEELGFDPLVPANI